MAAAHTVTERAVDALLARAGVDPGRVGARERLAGGSYNALYGVDLADGGGRLVLKVPPPAGTPRMRYEAELLCGEALFYEHAAAAGVPAPRVVHAEWAEDAAEPPFLLMTHSPGVPWSEVAETVEPAERARLLAELGGLVGRLHAVRGPGFGYPAGHVAPLGGDWPSAFAAMTGAVLADAEAYRPWLPRPVPEVRAALERGAGALAEVAEPALVHFDLWPGNVLLDGEPGARSIGGLIDGERMFWGDPLADFASLSLLSGPLEDDPAFLAGYGAAGGATSFDAAARVRLALYRCYLYLIMLVEVVPRGTDGEHLAWVRDFTGPRLAAALDVAAGS
jgi:aminoglycoside phosphotransferase (APT) family kinase protein